MRATTKAITTGEHHNRLRIAVLSGLVLLGLLLLAPKPSAAALLVRAEFGPVGVGYADWGPVPACGPTVVVGSWPWVSGCGPVWRGPSRPWWGAGYYWRAPYRFHRAWTAGRWRGDGWRPAWRGERHVVARHRLGGRMAPAAHFDRGGMDRAGRFRD